MANGIRIGGSVAGSVAGAAELQKLWRDYPKQVISDTRQLLQEGADELVLAIKEHVPVSDLEATAGELRDSVHRIEGRHDLSVLVVEDALDPKGDSIGFFVEHGHVSADGSHVPPYPHFWPAVRANSKKLRLAIARSFRRRAEQVG